MHGYPALSRGVLDTITTLWLIMFNISWLTTFLGIPVSSENNTDS
jgi:hypothetical protein